MSAHGLKMFETTKHGAPDSKLMFWISRLNQTRLFYWSYLVLGLDYRVFGDPMFEEEKQNSSGRWTHVLSNFSQADTFTELDNGFYSYTDAVDKAKFNSQMLIKRKIDPHRFVKSEHQALINSSVGIRTENSMPSLPCIPGRARQDFELVFGKLALSRVEDNDEPVELLHAFRDSVCAVGLGLKSRTQLVAHAIGTLYTRLATASNAKGRMQSGVLGRHLCDVDDALMYWHIPAKGFEWKRCVVMLQASGPKDMEAKLRSEDKVKITKIVEQSCYIEFGDDDVIGRVAPIFKRLKGFGSLDQEKAVVAAQNLLLNEYQGKVCDGYL
jgi:hypothetical protein